jgi:agmatinase
MTDFRPVAQGVSPRFAGVRTFMRLPLVSEPTPGLDFVVLGVPLDAATSFRSGARFGPEAIRSMSVLLRPYHPEHGIDMFDFLSGADGGDVPVIPGYVEDSYALIEDRLAAMTDLGALPVLLGGDHSVTLPELRVLSRRSGPLALVHFDAHTDTRRDHMGKPYGHGTPFRRAAEEGLVDPSASIQIGIHGSLTSATDVPDSVALGYEVMTREAVRREGANAVAKRIIDRVAGRPAFMTFDIDVLDPAYAPGTGTPTVGGLESSEALEILRALADIQLVGFDIVEVAPEYDHAGITALAAASVAWEVLALVALAKRRSGKDA